MRATGAMQQLTATSNPDLAARLLPEIPGWIADPASLTRGGNSLLCRSYTRGRTRAAVEVTAGASAAQVVAQAVNAPIGEETSGRVGSRTWLLRGRRAHLVAVRGRVYCLSVILRGGPGDLPGSVWLEVRGHALMPADAVALALMLDWDAIVAALAGQYPFDAARVAAASRPPVPPPPHQPILWPMLPSLPSMEQAHRLERRRPPRFVLAADQTPPVLCITARNFAPDLIWAGLHLASARLRNALGLGADAVEYGDVDASGSAAAAQAADYKVLKVIQQADPIDLARMYGHEPDRGPDGCPTTAWLLSITGPHAVPRRAIWREGFVPPAPLFRDGAGRLLATEALAERVTRAGVTDVMFQDVSGEAALDGLAFRPAPLACSPGG